MNSRIHLFIAPLLVALLVAACAPAAPPSPTNPPAPAGPKPTTAPAPTTASPRAAGTRLVKHAMGETQVPANPQRVVVLDMGELDMALALGVTPVGYATYTLDQPLPAYLADRAGAMQRVGTVNEPNLETITALKPDLILSNKVRHEKVYGQLSQIAPTVLAEQVGAGWKDSFRVVADALGKAAEAEQLMQRYRQRLEDFRGQMGSRLAQTQVSLVRSFPNEVRIMMKASFMGTIVQDAGLPRPPAQDKDVFMERATEERIPDLDGDVMFLMYWNRGTGEQLSRLTGSPLWAQLGVVQQGRVYEVDDETWGTGLGPMAADRVVGDLFKYLAGGTPAAGQSSGPRAAGERVVQHAMGETRVPANPRRVVVLDTGELDSALALGITPVGSVTGREGSGFPEYLGDRVAGIKSVGSYEQPNLESIAALKPDLILSSKLRHEKIYPQLSQIAPTVFTETVGLPWKENLALHAEALGKLAEGERLLNAYESRAAEFRTKMGDRLGRTRVSLVRALPDHIRVMMKASFAGRILEDAGLPRPPAQDKDVFMERVTSKEGIPLMDGDAIFVMQFVPEQGARAGEGTLLKGWLDDPLWKNLAAVQARRVYEVSDDVWARGIGILGANKVLDDLFRYLLPSGA